MKRVTTILKQINELENELYSNYTDKDILEGFDKLDTENYSYGLTSLLYVIATGVQENLKIDEMFK